MSKGETTFLLFVLTTFVEALFLSFWLPWYYRHGIPVFREVVRLSPTQMTVVPDLELNARFRTGVAFPRLVFRRLSDQEVGFQEGAALFRFFSYIPVMRGLIRYEPEHGQAVVTGILQWYAILAIGAILVAWDPQTILEAAAEFCAVLVILTLIWAIQRARFRAVAVLLRDIARSAA